MESYDILILGAGPAGLAAACEAQEQGLSHLIVDRRGLVHSFVEYPQTLRFFSPPDEMAIGGVPFPMRGGDKPVREDALAYYRAVAAMRQLNLATWESVVSLDGQGRGKDQGRGKREEGRDFNQQIGGFRFRTRREPGGELLPERWAGAVSLATGMWDRPVCLDCPGADLPHVSYRFHEPTEFFGHPVLVVGGGNSAVTAALALSEAHARVTFATRRPPVPYQSHLRPFIVRDLEIAVDEGKLDLHTGVVVARVESEAAWLQPVEYDPIACQAYGEPYRVPAHFVFALLGQTGDVDFLAKIGLKVESDGRPASDPTTFETEIPGLYVAGSLVHKDVDIVIKGREQARRVVQIIAERRRRLYSAFNP